MTLQQSTKKTLRFSDKSMLYLYTEDERYSNIKSYSASDKTRFSRAALEDAMRIRRALKNIKSASLPLTSQLEASGISVDEFLGLEQLTLEEPKNICKRRKTHIQALLLAQSLVHETKNGKDDVRRLVKVSTSITKKCSSQARQRAARAA